MMYRGQLGVNEAEELCLVPDACASTGSLSPLLILLSTGILTFIVVAAIVHLRDAQTLCEQERSRTQAERDAFAQFNRRLENIEVSSTPMTVSTPVPLGAVDSPPDDRGLERVRDVYRDTVMSVSHYDEDYGESLAENMRAEFGEEISTAVIEGSGLSSQLKGALSRKSEEAYRRRDGFLATIDRELEALEDADETFADVDRALIEENETPLDRRSFDDLKHLWGRLGEFEARCRGLLTTRQETLSNGSTPGNTDSRALHTYLYEPLSVTHPILADGAGLVDRLQKARRQVLVAITRRA